MRWLSIWVVGLVVAALSCGCVRFGFEDPAAGGGADGPRLLDSGPLDLHHLDRQADSAPDALVHLDAAIPHDGAAPLGAFCTDGAGCSSGHCAQGVCCAGACAGVCAACNLPGKQGNCSPLPVGKQCGSSCLSGFSLTKTCDGKGGCMNVITKPCPGNVLCDLKTLSCPAGCLDHSGCVKGTLTSGVCDRVNAHTTGLGACVAPSKVLQVSAKTPGGVVAALSSIKVGNSATHILLDASVYTTAGIELNSPGISVVVVGAGAGATTLTTTTDAAALALVAGRIALQGLSLTRQANTEGGGITCSGGTFALVESAVKGHSGLGLQAASGCAYSIRRSRIVGNLSGGLLLDGGVSATIVNNLIVNNGGPKADWGGVRLNWTTAPKLTFYNNTVVGNAAKAPVPAGIYCDVDFISSYDLHNSVVWGNGAPNVTAKGCTFHASDVQWMSPVTAGNIAVDPKLSMFYGLMAGSPCVDTAGAVPASVTTIDHTGGLRLKGTKVDMGALER